MAQFQYVHNERIICMPEILVFTVALMNGIADRITRHSLYDLPIVDFFNVVLDL